MSCGLLAVALTGSVLSAVAGPASASATVAGSAQAGASAAEVSGRVTLVTGDRLTVSGTTFSVEDNPARRGITFLGYTHEGHLNVIPSDAFDLLGSGKLDSRLFDVTALLQSGLGNGAEVPLIVTHTKDAKATARSSLTKGGGRIIRELPAVNGLAVRANSAKANDVWNQLTTGTGRARKVGAGVEKIWLDAVRRLTLDQSVPQVGAPSAWAAGFDGTGIKVGVVDSGIDSTHPDLAGKVVAASDFTGEGLQDLLGHGTHVASIVAGTGAASGGQFKGVAPGASLISGKACVVTNACFDSAIISALEYAGQQGADVINMSLGGADAAGVDPLEAAVNAVTATYGTLVVAAAGNTPFPAPSYSVSTPSTADSALSVGAVDPGDNLAFFSNRGPRVNDTAIKPEITAPGVGITAARSSTSSMPGDQYTELSGTSMATPHVAGAAAILAQRRPTWTPAQLKSGLMTSTFQPASARVFDTGAGRLDVARAYNATVLTSPPSVSLGRQAAPHGDDPVLNRTITYTNTNTSSGVNLTLSLTARDPSGAPAPAGMFAISTTSLSLAPGGTASVTLTATTSVAGPDGFYDGYVTATGQAGGVRVSTPFAVHRAPGGREFTFNHIDRGGNFAAGYGTLLLPLTPGKPSYIIFSTGIGPVGPRTEFIESGDYLFYNAIPDFSSGGLSVLVQPKLTVTTGSPTTINLDSSTAQPLNVTVPNPSAVTWLREVGAGYMSGNPAPGVISMNFTPTGETPPIWTRQLGPSNVFTPNFLGKVRMGLAVAPGGGPNIFGSTSVYNTAWFVNQQFPTGITKNVTAGQLATVNASHGKHVEGAFGFKDSQANPGSGLFPIQSLGFTGFPLPHTRTEFYNTEGNIRWYSQFNDLVTISPEQHAVLSQSAITTLTAGTTTTDTWNKPGYGPSLGSVVRPLDGVVRQGNTIHFNPPMAGDSGGHQGHPDIFFPVSGLTGTSTLKRNGVVVATASYPDFTTPSATVPPEWSPYTLETTVSRGAPVVLGTQISAVWAFNSSSVDPNSVLRLPLWTVTFKPTLNADNVAPVGSFQIPLTAVAQPGSPVAGINTITVQYSTNDGATWQNATVTGSGVNRTATVTHPNITGFVSLRATATDWAGNSVTQTTIRAYKIAP